jgi:hypothetical protein
MEKGAVRATTDLLRSQALGLVIGTDIDPRANGA